MWVWVSEGVKFKNKKNRFLFRIILNFILNPLVLLGKKNKLKIICFILNLIFKFEIINKSNILNLETMTKILRIQKTKMNIRIAEAKFGNRSSKVIQLRIKLLNLLTPKN